jgi:hypothetical protein
MQKEELTQSTDLAGDMSPGTDAVQDEPSNWSNRPIESAAMQNVLDVQEMASMVLCGATATGSDHVVPFQVVTSPAASAAAQKVGDAHESRMVWLSASIEADGAAWVQVLPFQPKYQPADPFSTAMHEVAVAQDTQAIDARDSTTDRAVQLVPLTVTAPPL